MEVRHKIEKKELQATVMQMKKSAPKGDKKRVKEVNQEIAKLQTEMAQRHKRELELAAQGMNEDEIAALIASGNVEDLAPAVQNLAIEIEENEDTAAGDGQQAPEEGKQRVSKAAKRREKKELEAKARRAAIEKEVAGGTDHRKLESEAFERRLEPLGLTIYPIPPDGHCLYNAVAHQLKYHNWLPFGKVEEAQSLRAAAADYIWNHTEEYLPFMVNDNGDVLTQDELFAYCEKIRNTNEWGGQVELRALSQALEARIIVYQSNAPPQELAGRLAPDDRPLRLAYHRHAYGLGEHYNSVVLLRKHSLEYAAEHGHGSGDEAGLV